MGILELLLLALGLSMDAFAVSVCKGLSMKQTGLRTCAACGFWFGSFQALMPAIGFFLGNLFAQAMEAIDHWVAFGLLAVIGINMLMEAAGDKGTSDEKPSGISAKEMFPLAVATSIDALAAGISLTMAGTVSIWWAVLLIGGVTFCMSCLGVKIGSLFGDRFQKKAQIVGGVILILLGVQVLAEHLGG